MRVVRAVGFVFVLVVAAVGALAVGERLRELRAPATGNALAGRNSPSPSQVSIEAARLRSLNLPPGYATASMRVAPDGRSLVVPIAQWNGLAMFEIPPNDAPLVLRGTTTLAGGEWLPDGSGYVMGVYLSPSPSPRNADGALSKMKQQQFSVFERDGSLTAIGSGWMLSRPSPDSQWIPVIDDCCPSTIRVLPRHGGQSRLLARLPESRSLFILGWDPRGRVLYTDSGRLFAVDLSGAIDEIATPAIPGSGERSYSYVGRSPDGSTVVLQVSGSPTPSSFALTRTGAVAIAPVFSDSWVGPHEILGVTKTKFLAIDTLTGVERDLVTKARTVGDGFVGTSSPYMLWREDFSGPLHLCDTRTGADRVIDIAWNSAASQRLDSGRFFLPSESAPAILDPAAWLGHP